MSLVSSYSSSSATSSLFSSQSVPDSGITFPSPPGSAISSLVFALPAASTSSMSLYSSGTLDSHIYLPPSYFAPQHAALPPPDHRYRPLYAHDAQRQEAARVHWAVASSPGHPRLRTGDRVHLRNWDAGDEPEEMVGRLEEIEEISGQRVRFAVRAHDHLEDISLWIAAEWAHVPRPRHRPHQRMRAPVVALRAAWRRMRARFGRTGHTH